jgi:hypothetical protein
VRCECKVHPVSYICNVYYTDNVSIKLYSSYSAELTQDISRALPHTGYALPILLTWRDESYPRLSNLALHFVDVQAASQRLRLQTRRSISKAHFVFIGCNYSSPFGRQATRRRSSPSATPALQSSSCPIPTTFCPACRKMFADRGFPRQPSMCASDHESDYSFNSISASEEGSWELHGNTLRRVC